MTAQQAQQGDKLFAAYRANVGGLNTSDSPFFVKDEAATGGYNFDCLISGAILKSLCPAKIGASPDSQLRTLGLALKNTKTSGKTIIRAAGTKIQLTDLSGTFTALTEDTLAAGSTFLAADTTQPVVNSMYVTPSTDVLWLAGGGMTSIYGSYSNTKVTANGAAAPTGIVAVTESVSGGDWAATGSYIYAVGLRKASTGALSNVALDVEFTLTNVANCAALDFTGLTGLDTTKFDRLELYRSTLNGADAFTAGDLVAEIDITSVSYTGTYTDTGASLASAQIVPRESNILLDNSPLPSGSYKTLTTWKRRLVTTSGSTIFIADINKPESWPTTNTITIPSGGEITGVAIISFTPNATVTDEFLAVFKETEVWVVTGTTYTDWSLKFVDYAGTLTQALIVSANGYLYFIDNRGVYLWDGLGKPIYVSRPIENLWGTDGKLDRAKLSLGGGAFFKRQNQVVWYLSHNDIGEQQFLIKLDLRLTLPQINGGLSDRMIDGVFTLGKVNDPVYACSAFVFPTSSSQELVLISGDAAGYTYRQFYDTLGVGANDYDFTYESKYLDQGKPNLVKQYYQVVAWVENLGNWPLTLDYWTEYRNSDGDKGSVGVTISPASANGVAALWDVGKWDVARWDNFAAAPKRLVFNLSASPYNNNQGEVLRLRFKNQNSDQPVTIYGFGVTYADLGTRT